jgi:hypothetical protein
VKKFIGTHPQIFEGGERSLRILGEQVVEQADGAEAPVHLGEGVLVQLLDDVALEVEGGERGEAGQVGPPHLLDVVLGQVKEGQPSQVPAGVGHVIKLLDQSPRPMHSTGGLCREKPEKSVINFLVIFLTPFSTPPPPPHLKEAVIFTSRVS